VNGELQLLRGRVAYLEADRQVVAEAVARERKRIRELALEHGAEYTHCGDCGAVPFADLLREDA
jgi:hypothetical protein